jgi:hypothetical protein
LKLHDLTFSQDEKEFTCVSSHYILIYSLEKLREKMAKDIYAEQSSTSQKSISNKEVIYTGRDSNLIYCGYHSKGVLLVISAIKKVF